MGDVPSLKFVGDIDPSDITQGGVGDCWLLSGISSLAEFDGAIARLFRKTEGLDRMPQDPNPHPSPSPNQVRAMLELIQTHGEPLTAEETTAAP